MFGYIRDLFQLVLIPQANVGNPIWETWSQTKARKERDRNWENYRRKQYGKSYRDFMDDLGE